MSACVCRLCQCSVPSAHAVCLFSQGALGKRLPGRITDMLDIPVDQKDGFLEYVREKCKCKLERLERAAEELEDFRTPAPQEPGYEAILHATFRIHNCSVDRSSSRALNLVHHQRNQGR